MLELLPPGRVGRYSISNNFDDCGCERGPGSRLARPEPALRRGFFLRSSYAWHVTTRKGGRKLFAHLAHVLGAFFSNNDSFLHHLQLALPLPVL